jgi:integrase
LRPNGSASRRPGRNDARLLNDRARVRVEKKYAGVDDYIFAGKRRGGCAKPPNLVCIVTLPALAENEDGPLQWKGWHAFRRSLATNLRLCGVDPRNTQAILKHSDMVTTREFYTQIPDDESRAALKKIDDWITYQP